MGLLMVAQRPLREPAWQTSVQSLPHPMAYRQISAAEWVTAGNKNGSFGSRFKFDGTGGRSRAGAGIDGDLVVGLHGFREGIGFALLPTSHHVAIGVQRSDDAGVAQPSGYHHDVLVLLQGHACMEVP